MEHAQIQPLPVADKVALRTAVTRLAFSRPPILDATRAIGLSDSELARLLGCSQMQVSSWATRRRPIPRVKLFAIWMFLVTLEHECFRGSHAQRAQILGKALRDLAQLSLEDAWPGQPRRIPESIFTAGARLAVQMLVRFEPDLNP
jgi:transcriptional regulator with XRE-family HTH domain